jgi:hypothetical protein
MSMGGEQAAKAFALRMALSAAGYSWRACTPDGGTCGFMTTSESGIKLLIEDYQEATETGISIDGKFTIITEVPLTEEQAAARRLAEEEAAKQAILDAEREHQEAIVEAEKAKERERKAASRRAAGKPTRDEWLAARGGEPWRSLGMSRRTWFRRQKKREPVVGGG